MKWVMSIAAGLAVGYFIYQMVVNGKNGGIRTTGRLHKSVKDKKISGVCAGIAEYLNMDPTIIRLIFALLAVGWGSGVLVYFILSFILPEGDEDDASAEEEEKEEENEEIIVTQETNHTGE